MSFVKNKNLIPLLNIENFLFLSVLLAEIFHFLFITFPPKIGIHDTFLRFSLQYFILNNAAISGEIPQWMPYVTHGRSSFWLYGIHGVTGILSNVFVYLGTLLKSFNFITLFNVSLLFDKLILLAGTWLLARRFFSSVYTTFFVTVCVMGSCVWASQIYFNFYLYYLLPLMIYFLHRLLDTGKWRYLFLSANLLMVQLIGNLGYFLAPLTLSVFLYFLFYVICNFEETWSKIKELRFGRPFFVCLAGLFILSIPLGYFVYLGLQDQTIAYSIGRDRSGVVLLENFLTYAVTQDPHYWLELILGISPGQDATRYFGLLPLVLAVFGLINAKRKDLHLHLVIFTLYAFSMGTFVSAFFYYTWPLMKYFRHTPLIFSIIKIFLCFAAGLGFEKLFIKETYREQPKRFIYSLIFIILIMGGVFMFLNGLHLDISEQIRLLKLTALEVPYLAILQSETLPARFLFSSSLAFLFSAVLAALLLIHVAPLKNAKRYLPLTLIIALCLHCGDLYGYAYFETKARTFPLSKQQVKTTTFQPMPYLKKRTPPEWGSNSRELLFNSLLGLVGTRYWVENAFLFKDELSVAHPIRIDHWSHPLDNLLRAYWGQSIHDLSVKPLGYDRNYDQALDFPVDHPAAKKIAGVDEDKIQFFSRAYLVTDIDAMVSKTTNNRYKGNILFLLKPDSIKTEHPSLLPWDDRFPLSKNTQLSLPYQIQHFSANRLEVKVNVPSEEKTAWMFYSDIWHPLWKATVNEKSVAVHRASLAYKAVPLVPGQNNVRFVFGSPWFSLAYLIIGLNSLFWVGFIPRLITKIFKNEKTNNQ